MDLQLVVFLLLANFTWTLAQQTLAEGSPCDVGDKNGTCVRLYRCPSAAAYVTYRRTGHVAGVRTLKEPRVCQHGTEDEADTLVCCTDCWLDDSESSKDEVLMEYGLSYEKKGPKAWKKCQEYFRDLPYACHGISGEVSVVWNDKQRCHALGKQSLGIGGEFALRGQFPHMALLGYGPEREATQWLCGGAVISPHYILTAAHCVSSPLLGNVSFAGLGILKRSELNDFWKVYKIRRIIPHPEYHSPSKYHDIALLETDTEINFGKEVLPACLDVGKVSRRWSSAPGWGRLGQNGPLADTLMVMELEEYNGETCSELFPPHRLLNAGYDNDSQMCYGRKDKVVDTCQGDSGGPLQVHVYGCLTYVVGVTSFGKQCGLAGNAGVYTRISKYLPWIESVVWPE